MEHELITALKRFGVTITTNEIPEVLRMGADTFLLRKGVIVPDKSLLETYLILNEMREQKIVC